MSFGLRKLSTKLIWSTPAANTSQCICRSFTKKADKKQNKKAPSYKPVIAKKEIKSKNDSKLQGLRQMMESLKKITTIPQSDCKSAEISQNISDTKAAYKNAVCCPDLDLIICTGPAGSGKTYIACESACNGLNDDKFRKIIITRPTVTIEENLGYLPGDINKKMSPWTVHMREILEEYFTKSQIEQRVKDGVIEISPLGFIQGRTFKNCIIIADEMQNSTIQQMFMLLTRIGEGSKMIVNGDISQTKSIKNGLRDFINKLQQNYSHESLMEQDGIKLVNLEKTDIQRHRLVSTIVELYENQE